MACSFSGPSFLALYIVERLIGSERPLSGAVLPELPDRQRWWFHVGGAAAMVSIACLVNPYGVRGALFPLELFPKITAWGGLYKSYITEFGDLRESVRRYGPTAAANLYLLTECFLLGSLPPSFIIPAVWRAGGASAARSMLHIVALVLALILILASVLVFSVSATGSWLIWVGWLAPLGLVALASLGAA